MNKYYRRSIEDLTAFCQKHDINKHKKKDISGHPPLFLFSLGDFYPGGVYDYNSKDADALIERIKHSTRYHKDDSLLDILKRLFNN